MTSHLLNNKVFSADVRFTQFAGALFFLLMLIAIWLVRDQMVLISELRKLQTETLSLTITLQKTSRNLDELRRQGERVLFATTPEERKQALLVVQRVVNSPEFVQDMQVSALAGDAERFLQSCDAGSRLGECSRAQWPEMAQRMSLLASDISYEGLNLGVSDLKAMEVLVSLNQKKLVLALSLIAVFLTATLLVIRRSFIGPLQRIRHAIEHIEEDAEKQSTTRSNIREIMAVEYSVDSLRVSRANMRESEARFRTVVEMTPDAIVLHRDGKLLFVNPAAIEMFGAKSAQELLDKPAIERVHPDFHKLALERARALTEQGSTVSRLEEKYVRLDGTEFYADAQSQRIVLSGQPAVLTTLRDITERKQSDAKQQIAASVFRHAREGIAVTDASGIMIEINDSFTRITGYGRQEAVGKNPRILQSGRQDVAFYVAMWADLIAHGFWSGEIWNRRKSGEVFPVQLTICSLRDAQGNNVGYTALFSDITERKNRLEALRQSEEKHRQLLDNSHDIIFTLDAEGVFTFVSPSWTTHLGHSLDQVLGQPFAPFVYPDDLGICTAALQNLFATGQRQRDVEYRVRHRDGSWLWFSANALPQRDKLGQVIAFEGNAKNITEHKALEAQVRQMAYFDALTGLPNRRMLADRLSQAMATSKRTGLFCALMFLDLDNFKPINDTCGHEAGDLLLVEVARRMSACLREMDTVARFGGDEFVVMLTELNADKDRATAQARGVAEKISASVAMPFQLPVSQGGQQGKMMQHYCSVSTGVVMFVNHQASQAELLKQADSAMYEAKVAGRNTICFYGLVSVSP